MFGASCGQPARSPVDPSVPAVTGGTPPVQTVVTPPAPAPPRLGVTKILAFGDSITAGEITSASGSADVDPAACYPAQLQWLLAQRYPNQPIVVVNDGKIGETAADGAGRLPQELAANRPDVVLLLEGINDIHGSVGEAGIPPAVNAVIAMIDDARGGGAAVIVGTLLPAVPGALRPGTVALIAPFNAQLTPLAAAHGAVVVDLYSPFSADLAGWLGPDGLHPTAAGYLELAQLFFASLTGHFETSGAGTSHNRHRAGPQ